MIVTPFISSFAKVSFKELSEFVVEYDDDWFSSMSNRLIFLLSVKAFEELRTNFEGWWRGFLKEIFGALRIEDIDE